MMYDKDDLVRLGELIGKKCASTSKPVIRIIEANNIKVICNNFYFKSCSCVMRLKIIQSSFLHDYIQDDLLYIAAWFWYLVKSDLSTVR